MTQKEFTFENLSKHTRRLDSLMACPEPGLRTWLDAVREEVDWIAEFWHYWTGL